MAKLQLIFDGKIKQEYELNKAETSIGRSPSNDIVIDNRGVSGKHALIVLTDNNYILKDLDSTNGTKLNGKKVSRVELNHGDHINLFKHTLNFVLVSAEQQAHQEGTVPSHSSNSIDPDATIMLDAKHVKKMVSNYKNEKKTEIKTGQNKDFINQPVLEITSADEVNTIVLSNKSILIGKQDNCHIQTGGWLFTPAISAVIKKDMSGMYTIKPETTIKLNGKKIKDKQLLKNGDRILIRNTLIVVMI
ncbi:MAG: FHA domain-containing protein [Pseudomonadota bacterium]